MTLLCKHNSMRQQGFGIVEVIASLLILSICLLPLMDLMQNLQRRALQIEDRQTRAEIIQSALSYFRTVNVGERPVGEQSFGAWSLKWEAQLVDDDTSFLQRRRQIQPRRIGLFDVSLEIGYTIDDRPRESRHVTRAVGWSETGTFAAAR